MIIYSFSFFLIGLHFQKEKAFAQCLWKDEFGAADLGGTKYWGWMNWVCFIILLW